MSSRLDSVSTPLSLFDHSGVDAPKVAPLEAASQRTVEVPAPQSEAPPCASPIREPAGAAPCVDCGADQPKYLSVKSVAQRYEVSVATVWRWAQKKPSFPKGVQLSPGTTRWYLPDLLAFEMMLQREGG